MSAIGALCWRAIERADNLGKGVDVLSNLGRRGIPFAVSRSRLERQDKLFEFRHGLYGKPIYLRGRTTDAGVFEDIFVHHAYDPQNVPLWEDFIRRTRGASASIVDCGANIGLSSVFFAEKFPAAQVLAVEPEPGNFEILRRNAAAYPNIRPIHGGVWDCAGSLTIVDPNLGAHGMRTAEAAASGGQVPAFTMPQLLKEAGDGWPVITKIDIEGAEEQLFRTNTDWLDNIDLLIIELHDWLMPGRSPSANFFRAIAGRRFEVLQSDCNLFLFFDRQGKALGCELRATTDYPVGA